MERKQVIDVARGIAIALVVLGHNRIGDSARTVLYAFHVPAFFLLTGATFNYARHRDTPAAFASDRFRRLVVPYLFSAVFFYLVWYFISRRVGESHVRGVEPWIPLAGIVYGNAVENWLVFNAPLWFLPALFLSSLVLWLFLRLTERTSEVARMALALGVAVGGYCIGLFVILPWGADVAPTMLPFMLLGYELNRYRRIRDDAPPLPAFVGLLAAGMLGAVVWLNGSTDVAQRRFHDFPLFVVGGVSGAILVLEVAWLAVQWAPLAALLSRLGRESLIILVFHLLGMQVLSAVCVFIFHQGPEPMLQAFWWLYVVVGIGFSLLAARVIRRVAPLRAVYYGTRS